MILIHTSLRNLPTACRGFVLLSLLWAVSSFFPSIAVAAPSGSVDTAAALGGWFIQFTAILVAVSSIVTIYSKLRTSPPIHRQYSAIDHTHADSLSRHDQIACSEAHTRELMTIRQEMGGFTAKVERQLDHLRNAITTQNSQMMAEIKELDEKQEKRIQHLHERLDPLPSAIAVNTRSVETHLADHRAGKA